MSKLKDDEVRDSSQLERLSQLIPSLPPFPNVIGSFGEWTRHEMECGTSLSRPLLILPNLSLYQWFNSAGTSFPQHTHEQDEYLFVIEGAMKLFLTDLPETILKVGRFQFIPKGAVHRAEFLEDCWYTAATIPRNPDWPS